MLVLAIIIALLGIVNTLALSVVERTRELGLLGAIGMRRGQIAQMVAAESVIIAVIGAVLLSELGAGLNHPACANVSAGRDRTGRAACWAT